MCDVDFGRGRYLTMRPRFRPYYVHVELLVVLVHGSSAEFALLRLLLDPLLLHLEPSVVFIHFLQVMQ